MISSTCFGQTFAHLQERKTEVFTTCGIMSCCCGRQGFGARHEGKKEAAWVKQLPSHRTHSATLPSSEPLPTTTTGHYTTCCKNLSLALLKMVKSLPETCWADHWRSIKLLLLHLVGHLFTYIDDARSNTNQDMFRLYLNLPADASE